MENINNNDKQTIISYDKYEAANKKIEECKRELQEKFSVKTDYWTKAGNYLPWTLSSYRVNDKHNNVVYSPFLMEVGEKKRFGNFVVELRNPYSKTAQNLSKLRMIANTLKLNSYSLENSQCFQKPYYILTKEGDSDWLDMNTGKPAEFPLIFDQAFGMVDFLIMGSADHRAQFQNNWYLEVYIKDIAKPKAFIDYSTATKKLSGSNVWYVYNNLFSDKKGSLFKGFVDLVNKDVEEKKKLRNKLLNKIREQELIVKAFQANKTLEEAKRDKSEEFANKKLLAQCKRTGEELEKLTKLLLAINQVKSAIVEVEKHANDESYKYDFRYFDKKIQGIKSAADLIYQFTDTQEK